MKPKIKPKTIIPEQYWGYLNVFNQNEINQLPSIGGEKNKPRNRTVEKNTPTVHWGPLYNMSKDKFLVLKKTLTEYLDKCFIRINNSPAATLIFFR